MQVIRVVRSARRLVAHAVAASAVVCSLLVVVVPAATADRLVTTGVGNNLDAFVGTFGWTGFPPTGNSHLVLFANGKRRFVPLKIRGDQYLGTLSLGLGRDGAPLAAYSRCVSGLGRCDLFTLGLRSGREQKLRSLSSRRWSEDAVAVWGGRYLFRRSCPGGPSCRGAGLFYSQPLRRVSRLRVSEFDLHGGAAALTPAGLDNFPQSIEVGFLFRHGGLRRCPIATLGKLANAGLAPQGGFFVDPIITRRFVYWTAVPDTSDEGDVPMQVDFLRRRIPSRACHQRAPVQKLRQEPIYNGGLVVTSGRVFYTEEDDQTGKASLFEMTDPVVRDP